MSKRQNYIMLMICCSCEVIALLMFDQINIDNHNKISAERILSLAMILNAALIQSN